MEKIKIIHLKIIIIIILFININVSFRYLLGLQRRPCRPWQPTTDICIHKSLNQYLWIWITNGNLVNPVQFSDLLSKWLRVNQWVWGNPLEEGKESGEQSKAVMRLTRSVLPLPQLMYRVLNHVKYWRCHYVSPCCASCSAMQDLFFSW